MIANNKSKDEAVGYIRVSSKDQVEGYSLDFQTEAIQNYCKDRYNLKNIYIEEGVGGKTVRKREAFQQMLQDGYASEFDVLIVWKLDRFTRDIETGVATYFGLKNQGIKIVSIHEGFDSGSDDIIPLLNIGIADKNRKDLIVNIKRGTKAKLKGDPRIGHTPKARYWDEDGKLFRLKEDEAAEWRTVAKQYLAGMSVAEIGRLSKERDSKTVPTTGVNIRRHLRKSLGDIHTFPYDGEVYEFPCEPIVDEATKQAVVKLMDKRKHAPNVRPDKFLLSGKIRCAECGKKLNSHYKNYNKKNCLRYYIHSDRNDCGGVKGIRVDHIDAAALKECFIFFGVDKKAYEKAIAKYVPDAKARKEIENDIKSLKRQLAKCEKEKDNFVNKLLGNKKLNDSIVEAANKKVDTLDERIDETTEALQQKEQRLVSMITPEEYKAKAEEIRDKWKNVFTGFETMEEMPWQNRKYLIDQMFDGTDEDGRPFGVYVRKVAHQVFDYEIYGRFTEGALFMKNEDSDYDGPEIEPIQAGWDRQIQAEKEAYRAKKKSCSLKMGDTGLEPVTSCV